MRRLIPTLITATAITLTVAAAAHAQPTLKKPGFEFVVPTGSVVPTGAQSDSIKRGNLTALQASYGIRPDLVLTSTFGWARTRSIGSAGDARLDMFTYDIGAEYRLARRSTDKRVNLKPFAGAGAGARTYNYRHVDTATTHDIAAYVSAGAEIGVARVRLRLEARDYITASGLAHSGDAKRKNDVAFLAGLRLALR
jgi:hypothetical protein